MGSEAENSGNWSLPAELQGETPRRVRLTGAGRTAVCGALLLTLAAFGTFLYLNRISRRLQVESDLLRSDSRETEGQIFEVRKVGSGASDLIEVVYTFRADERPIGGKSTARMSDLAGMKAGGPIRVRYFGGDPAINRPADWEPSPPSNWLGLALPGLMTLIAGGILYKLRRQRGLVSEGLAAAAVITGMSRTKSGWVGEYEFRPPSGEELKGLVSMAATKPEIGSAVPILYDPAKPRRNTRYPNAWYRAGE